VLSFSSLLKRENPIKHASIFFDSRIFYVEKIYGLSYIENNFVHIHKTLNNRGHSSKEDVMKICFPVSENQGFDSIVYGHFGSAPSFIIVDTDTRKISEVHNRDEHHAHGACQPLKALGGQVVDAIVVGGIGAGALMGLNHAGLKVYQAQGATIADNIACLAQSELPILTAEHTCGGHAHGQGGCSH
jgi:predicted Fe-Mo cluster-binding NifX family protein